LPWCLIYRARSVAGTIQGGWEYVTAAYAVVWGILGLYAWRRFVHARRD
jgi:hypothetical protein